MNEAQISASAHTGTGGDYASASCLPPQPTASSCCSTNTHPFPPSAFLSLPQLPGNLHWAQRSELRTVFCRCSKPPGPPLVCLLCQPVPFVASTSTYPGPTPSAHHGLYLCLEFPFPNCVLRNAYHRGAYFKNYLLHVRHPIRCSVYITLFIMLKHT